MKFRTLLLSLLTTCTGHSALAQTFNEVVYSPKSTTFSLTTSPDVKKVDVVISDNDSDTAQQLVKSMKRVGPVSGNLRLRTISRASIMYSAYIIKLNPTIIQVYLPKL